MVKGEMHMKMLNEITIKNMVKNRKRSIVTILGISLSVALICAVTTFVGSFQTSMANRVKEKEGNYHIYVSSVTQEQQKYLENHVQVEKVGISQAIGYAKTEELQNEYKPYLYIEAVDDVDINNKSIVLTQGRLPQNSEEIVIPEHTLQNGKAKWKIGDTITLPIGERTIDGEKLGQHNPYLDGTDEDGLEQFTEKETRTYQIVGVMERPNFEDYSAPGYTAITKWEKPLADKPTSLTLTLKKPKEAYSFVKEIEKNLGILGENIETHDSLLAQEGVFKSDRTNETIAFLAIIVIAIIIFTSAFVIRNSFTISLTEKTKELGMLASIGATTKQIRNSILWEGVILGIISVPLGCLVGIFAIGIVLMIVNGIIQGGGTPLIDHFELNLVISWQAVGVAVLLSAIMIFISSLWPAIRASKIAPIDAIRENKDIKVKNRKKLKTSKWIGIIFGVEGEIASKNFKRSKKKYRTTIFSIFLSIVLFISMSSIVDNVFGLSSLEYKDRKYNLSINMFEKTEGEANELLTQVKQIEGVKQVALEKRKSVMIDPLQYYSPEAIEQKGIKSDHYGEKSNIVGQTLEFVSLGDEVYKSYLKEVGISPAEAKGKAILYDTNIYFKQETGKDGSVRVSYEILNVGKGDTITYQTTDTGNQDQEVITGKGEITIATRTDKLPMGSLFSGFNVPVLIVSDETMKQLGNYNFGSLIIECDQSAKVKEQLSKIDTGLKDDIYDYDEQNESEKSMILIISIFLYGFIAVISVIGITNVFNTITTNMALRNREFAILKSMGMTQKEFRKMIHFESLLYGTKALLFGLPVGVLLSYSIYKVTTNMYETPYQFPWMPIVISIVFVFAIIFLSMHYSVKKTESQNTIETIRKENN